jgi:hypothetical protein
LDDFSVIAQRSQVLHGNKYVLPVAMAVVELDLEVVKAPEICVTLKGFVPGNRVHEGLRRLCAMGVMAELPYIGRPNPRLFERCPSAYWDFVVSFATEHLSSQP